MCRFIRLPVLKALWKSQDQIHAGGSVRQEQASVAQFLD